MPKEKIDEEFRAVTQVVSDPLRFKMKLDIGEDVYSSLKMKKYVLDAWDAGQGAISGAAFAGSPIVASTFFAPTGILGVIGIGTAATPLGWAIAAGVIGAGLTLTYGKLFVRGSSARVSVIPDFINTPLDLLAVGLFDMIGMLGIKLAAIDGEIDKSEVTTIKDYFVSEWGYDEAFVTAGLKRLEENHDSYTIQDIALKLAELKYQNPDCNYQSMSKEIVSFLHEISEADQVLDERESLAIEKIESIFKEVGSLSYDMKKKLEKTAQIAKTGIDAATNQVSALGKTTVSGAKSIGETIASKLTSSDDKEKR